MKKVLLFAAIAMTVASFSSCSKGNTCMCREKIGPFKGDWVDYSDQADNKSDCKALAGSIVGVGMECEMR